MITDLTKLIEEGRERLIHLYDDQLNGLPKYSNTSNFEWYYNSVWGSGILQDDPHPQYTEYITAARVVSPSFVTPSGTLLDKFPETNAFGRTSSEERTLPPRLQAGGALDIRGFRRLMHDMLKIVQPDIKFVPAYPDWVKPTDLRTVRSFPTQETLNSSSLDQQGSEFIDTITFKVKSRLCGILDEHASANVGGKREIKPRVRQTAIQSKVYRNKLVNVYGQWFDNFVQFDLFTRTNEEAELFIEWFEDFMETYTSVFMWAGISKMHYWERLVDEELTRWKTGLSIRSVIYYIRTEKLYEIDVHKIKQINLTLFDLITNESELRAFYEARRQYEPWKAMASGLAW